MAASSMAIGSGSLVTAVNGTANAASDLNTNISAVVAAFNASLETATGHNHDGTNARSISSGVAGLTMTEYTVARIMGWYL